MTPPPTPPAPIAVPVVPPHRDADPLSPAQLRIARTRIALQELTAVVEDLEACDVSVRQRACEALATVVELQAVLRATTVTEASV